MSGEAFECPICSKSFDSAAIEAHVSKCLFLNESNQNQSNPRPKRPNAAIESKSKSPMVKKPKRQITKSSVKTTGESSVVTKSRESTPEQFSDKNVDSEPKRKPTVQKDSVPLAEKMRPSSLQDYVGQSHAMGKQSILFQLLKRGEIPNVILWGPPGCGKTSLANVIAHVCKQAPGGKLRYVKLSAAMSGVADVKEAITIASNELKFGRRTVIFMDEIHRFNKAQQDIFLPHIESGTITLIGATTENPSFSLNSALLSRCRVIVLEKLSTLNLIDILSRAVDSMRGFLYKNSEESCASLTDFSHLDEMPRFIIDAETIEWLAETCDGDARIALGGLELAVQSVAQSEREFLAKGPGTIGLEHIQQSLKKTHMLYDRKGDQHYDIISALHKSVRASDENAALYWLTRMMAGGEDPVYIARRLVRAACEDIGLEDPKALGIAVNTMQGCKIMGMPECDVLLAQCVTYLARAPKSRLMENALRAAQRLVASHKGAQPCVPLHLRNAPTKLMGNLGYGRGYNMMHKDESGLNYLPEGLEDVDFFQDSDNHE